MNGTLKGGRSPISGALRLELSLYSCDVSGRSREVAHNADIMRDRVIVDLSPRFAAGLSPKMQSLALLNRKRTGGILTRITGRK